MTAGCRAVASTSGQQVTGQLHNSAAMSSWSSGRQQTSSVQLATEATAGQQNAGSASLSAQRHDRVPLREITPAEQGGEASGAAWASLNRHAAGNARASSALHNTSIGGGGSGGGSRAAGLGQWQPHRGQAPAGRQQHISLVARSHPASSADAASGVQLHDDEGTALLCWGQCW